MDSSPSLEPLSYSNVLGDIDGAVEAASVTLRKFGVLKTVYAGKFFRRVRRDCKTEGYCFGVEKRLVYDIIPLATDEACGRTSVYVDGMRVDGNYLSPSLAGRLFVTTLTGGVHKVELKAGDRVLPAGGLHDTIVLVLPKKASVDLDNGVWPVGFLPPPEVLSDAVAYCTKLRAVLKVGLTPSQYRRLLGRTFVAQSAFGEVISLVVRLFMLSSVSLYHLIDCASLFVGAYCGKTEERRRLVNYLACTARFRREDPGPHAWALGTLLQVMAETSVGVRLNDVLSEYNKYARHTIPVYARDVVRGVLGVEVVDEVLLRLAGFLPHDHEHYLMYMGRLITKLDIALDNDDITESDRLRLARAVVVRCREIQERGVNSYNAGWHKTGWRFGQFIDV